jgi:hypothetical protein
VSKQETTVTDFPNHELTWQEVAANCLRRIHSRGQVERRSASDPPDTAIRCLLDVTKIPPDRFALPDDGRKRKALCDERKAVAIQLASAADPDGSNITLGAGTVAKRTGRTRPTIVARFEDLERLGLLKWDGKWKRWPDGKTTKIRRLDLRSFAGVKDSSNEGVKDSGAGVKHSSTGVKDSTDRCKGLTDGSRESFTQPPLEATEKQPNTQPNGARDLSLDFQKFVDHIPIDKTTGEPDSNWVGTLTAKSRAEIEKLIERDGWEKVATAARVCWQHQDPGMKGVWSNFLSLYDNLWLKKVDPHALGRLKDPDYDKKRRAVFQAEIQRQEAELSARRKAFAESEQKPVEMSADEFLSDE